MTKKQRIIDYLIKYPNADVAKVAVKFATAKSTIYKLRKEAGEVPAVPATDTHQRILPKPFAESPRASDRQVGGDHYKDMGVEPWDVIDTWPLEQRIGYYRGGALKYTMRMGSKDQSPLEIAKGQHYMQKLLEVLNEQPE